MNANILYLLAKRIGEIEANERPSGQTAIALTKGLAELFPGGCLPVGVLIEFLSAAEGTGAWTLALLMGKEACAARKVLVVADERRCFYPPAACKLGVDLQRTLIIRPRQPASAVAALVQSLRCTAVGAVIGGFERLGSVEYRRMQLAAETGGGVGFLLRPAAARGPSFAAVRFLVTPVSSSRRGERGRRLQIEVLRMRGGKAGRTFLLEIDHETGDVHLPPALAVTAAVARSAGASG